MANLVVEAELDWRKRVQDLEEGLKALDEELKNEGRSSETEQLLYEQFDHKVMKQRCEELKKLKSSLKNLSDTTGRIQLDVQTPVIPGVHLLVNPQNQSAIASFFPNAYDAVVKAPTAVNALNTLARDSADIEEKMNKAVLAMTQENRHIASRVEGILKEKRDLDAELILDPPMKNY